MLKQMFKKYVLDLEQVFWSIREKILHKKYVICRPRGGLNDMLCQIEICYTYCVTYNRFLIIDSPFINSSFFEIRKEYSKVISLNLNKIYPKLKEFSVFPSELQNRINSYETYYENTFFRDKKTNTPIFFELNKIYKEDVLVYEQWGGGEQSIHFLKKIFLHKDILKEINVRLKKLPDDYVSIHIRNTDYKTDYKDYYKTIKKEMQGKNVLICTDDTDCIEYTKNFFDHSNIFTISKNIRPDLQNELKKGIKSQYINELHIDRLADLFGMAFSKKIYHTKCYAILPDKNKKETISGFVLLAKNIQKETLLKNKLLNRETTNLN